MMPYESALGVLLIDSEQKVYLLLIWKYFWKLMSTWCRVATADKDQLESDCGRNLPVFANQKKLNDVRLGLLTNSVDEQLT